MSNLARNDSQRLSKGTSGVLANFRQALNRRKLISRLPAPMDISRTQSLRLPASVRPNVSRAVEDPDPTPQDEPQPSDSNSSTVRVVEENQPSLRPVPANLTRAATFRFQPTWGALAKRKTDQNPEESTQLRPQPQRQLTSNVNHPSVTISLEAAEEYIQLLEEKMRRKIKDFPSVRLQETRGGQFIPSWNWLNQYRRILNEDTKPEDSLIHVKSLYANVTKAHQILEQVRLNFQYGILLPDEKLGSDPDFILNHFATSTSGRRGRMTLDEGSFEYIGEMFQNLLKQQDTYSKWQSKILETPDDRKKRNEVVKWACKTVVTLKYPAETTHVAVYLIDAFLSSRAGRMTSNSWFLLGITSLHIAGKMEEPDPASVSRLIRLSGHYYRAEDVYWMETNILKQLQFDVNPPLAPTFAKLVLLGGSLDFPNHNITKLVMDLTHGILYKSLLEYRLSSIRPSDKAQAALEIGVEFIFSQYKTYSTRTIDVYNFEVSEPGKIIGDFAVDLCLDTLRQRFMRRKLPKIEPSVPCVASPVRNIKV